MEKNISLKEDIIIHGKHTTKLGYKSDPHMKVPQKPNRQGSLFIYIGKSFPRVV